LLSRLALIDGTAGVAQLAWRRAQTYDLSWPFWGKDAPQDLRNKGGPAPCRPQQSRGQGHMVAVVGTVGCLETLECQTLTVTWGSRVDTREDFPTRCLLASCYVILG
jgi:hypothetical protein